MRLRATLGIFFLLALASHVEAQAPAKRSPLDQAMDQLFATRRYREVRLSPDGRRVVWVQDADGGGTGIYVAGVTAPAGARKLTAATGKNAADEGGVAWSRDGKQLAFLSDASKAGQRQLYIAPAAGGAAKKLTQFRGFVAGPQWSPNGKTVSVLYTEGAVDAAGPFANKSAPTGVIGEEQIREQRIALVDVATGRVHQVSPVDLCIYEYDWSPDGRHIVATGAHGSCDNNWYLAQIWSIEVPTGETKSLYAPQIQLAVPKWSPDGTRIAFLGGLMSDEPLAGGDVYVLPAAGGEARNLTPGMKASASWISWLPGTSRILMAQYVDGKSGLATVDGESGAMESLWSGEESIAAEGVGFGFNVSLSADGKVSAAVRESYTQPPEVWVGAIGDWKKMTRANEKLQPRWGEAHSVHWKSDRFTVQGWLIQPKQYDPQSPGKYPLVVVVHGGPVWASTPAWPETFYNATLLSNEGYFVFYPNPRGSHGWGQDFTKAVVKDIGIGDLKDILAGVDEVQKSYAVDPNRIGLTGLSYGGYFAMWAPTQSKRFKATVSMGGLANWQSYYGQNGIDQWMIPFFGASVYDDPDVYAKSSPIEFIKRTNTPTLILVGEGDIETPVPQSYEYWHALKAQGVPTQMVIYPGEGHFFAKPEHRRDVMRRMMQWFDRYLKNPVRTDE